MTAILITADTPNWQTLIAEHLANGEDALVKFKPNGYSPLELGEEVGIGKHAIIYYIRTGRLEATRSGQKYNITAKEAKRFIKWYESEVS